MQVQVYSVDFETGGLTLLQTLDVVEEPSRIVVTDAGEADAFYMVSEESLLLTAFVLNAVGQIRDDEMGTFDACQQLRRLRDLPSRHNTARW